MPEHTYPSRQPAYLKRYEVNRRRGIRRSHNPARTRDQLRALASAGWSAPQLAARLGGVSPSAVHQLQSGHRRKVFTGTAERVDRLYRELHHIPGPSRKAATHAAERGWPSIDDLEYGPLTGADSTIVDQVAIERALAGDQVTLTREERRQVVATLTDAGESSRQIAEKIGVTRRSVVRHRASGRAA